MTRRADGLDGKAKRGSTEADAKLLVLVLGCPFRGGRDGAINSSILDMFHLRRMRGDVR